MLPLPLGPSTLPGQPPCLGQMGNRLPLHFSRFQLNTRPIRSPKGQPCCRSRCWVPCCLPGEPDSVNCTSNLPILPFDPSSAHTLVTSCHWAPQAPQERGVPKIHDPSCADRPWYHILLCFHIAGALATANCRQQLDGPALRWLIALLCQPVTQAHNDGAGAVAQRGRGAAAHRHARH